MKFDRNTTIIIFGATGDLTWRKLIPGLYNNFKKGRLSNCAHVVGYARRPYTDATWRDFLKSGVVENSGDTFSEEVWQKFADLLSYFQGNLDVPNDYQKLASFLTDLEQGEADRLYYLATAPEHFSLIVSSLGEADLARESVDGCWRRIVVEKPFGTDLESAQELNPGSFMLFLMNPRSTGLIITWARKRLKISFFPLCQYDF